MNPHGCARLLGTGSFILSSTVFFFLILLLSRKDLTTHQDF